MHNKFLLSFLFAFLLSFSLINTAFSTTIKFDWNDTNAGMDGWNGETVHRYYSFAQGLVGGFRGAWVDNDRYSNNGYIALQNNYRPHYRYYNWTQENGKDSRFTTNEVNLSQTNKPTMLTFDIRQYDINFSGHVRKDISNDLFSYNLNGSQLTGNKYDLGNGWVRHQAVLSNQLKNPGALVFRIHSDQPHRVVELDNFKLEISDSEKVSVKLDNKVFRVPVGYRNFSGVVDASGNFVSTNKETAGKLLATAQALEEIEAYALQAKELKASLIEMTTHAKLNATWGLAANLLGSTLGNYLSYTLSGGANVYATAAGILTDLDSLEVEAASHILALGIADSSAMKAIENINKVIVFENKIQNALQNPNFYSLSIEEISEARMAMRLAVGQSLASVEVIKTTYEATSTSYMSNLVVNLGNQVGNIAMSAGGLTNSVVNFGLTSIKETADVVNVLNALTRNIKAARQSPLEDKALSDYENIAEQRGYAFEPTIDPLAGLTPPTIDGSIIMHLPYYQINQGTSIPSPTYVFQFDTILGEMAYIDPEIAIGYDYIVNSGSNFMSVLMPEIGDNLFDLWLWNDLLNDYIDANIILSSGVEYFFEAGGVDRFRVMGIEEEVLLDPYNSTGFITGLSFYDTGTVNMSQIVITKNVDNISVPEPTTLILFGIGLVGMRFRKN